MIRFLAVLVILIAGALSGYFVYHRLTAGLSVVLAAPTALQVTVGDKPQQPGVWINRSNITLEVDRPMSDMGLDVEIRRAGRHFSDSPTAILKAPGSIASTCRNCTSVVPAVQVHLGDGSYHWQARLHNSQGVSPWVAYRGTIRVDTRAPTIYALASPTDPHPQKVYHSGDVRYIWSGQDEGSGVAGYSYRLDTDASGQALPAVRTTGEDVTLHGLDTGTYYFHVRAVDRAGNWGPGITVPLHIDVTPPGLEHVSFSQFTFDPLYDRLGVSFAVTRSARTVRVGFYHQSDGSLVRLYVLHHVRAGQERTIRWDGKDSLGRLASAGTYEVYVRPIDRYGHSSLAGWNDLVLEYKRIVISLGQQRLWAYDGSHLFLTSLVTTGNRLLPTPTGTFHILAKFHPFTFHSPWPKSSPYWYPPSLTQWAMLFQQGGYYIHDAPWRSVFGPGTNAQLGTPGNNYTGTHGCVNVPANVAQELFAWAPIGTVVIVHQ
jgi:hypothetical protein